MVEKVLLASPRGYCAGVERAVETVERALELYGAPVYVRKQIVHNLHVVRELEERGAVFVDDWGLVSHDPRRLLGRMFRSGDLRGPGGEVFPGAPQLPDARRVDATIGEVLASDREARERAHALVA